MIVAKRVATPLLTVQHQALVHGLDTPRVQRPSRDLASPPVDVASLVAGWENYNHLPGSVTKASENQKRQKHHEAAVSPISPELAGAPYSTQSLNRAFLPNLQHTL